MKKRILIPLVLAVALVGLVALVLLGIHHKTIMVETVRVGTLRGGVSSLDVIEYLHLDKETSIRVKVIRFTATLDIANAIARGDIDVAVIPVEFVAKLWERGYKVGVIAVDFYQNQAVIARGNVNAKTLEDLEGMRIGVFTPTGTYAMFRAYTRIIYHKEPLEMFKIVNLPPTQLVEAFARGDIDAAVVWEPIASMLVADYGGKIVVTFQQLWRRVLGKTTLKPVMIVYAARLDWARKHEHELKTLLELRSRAAHLWNTNRSLALRILEEYYHLTPRAAQLCWSRLHLVEAVNLNKPLEESMRMVWNLAWRGGYLPYNPSRIPDTIFIKLATG